MTTDTITKQDMALKTLRKNRWVPRDVLVEATRDNDLRSVRRLREKGYDICTRTNAGKCEYRRTN